MSTKTTTAKPPIPLGYRLKAGDEAAFSEVTQALENMGGQVVPAAEELRINPATLYRLLRRYPQLQRAADGYQQRRSSLQVLADSLPRGVHTVVIDTRKEAGGTALRDAICDIIAN